MSFFGKKATKSEAETRKSYVISTGGKIDDIVSALIDAANDGNDAVKQKIIESLQDIGRKQPELVLSTCIQFIKTQGKGKRPHVVLLLHLILQLLEHDLYNISEQLAIFLIQMALGEMTKEKSVEPDWQGPASMILVTIGKRFPSPVWTVLVELFPVGTIPHYFVIKTMGDLSVVNSTAIVPNLKEVMARALPILGQIKKDNMRWVFASSFGRWCEAILNYLADAEKNGEGGPVTKDTFSSEVYPAYEVIFNHWIGARESKIRLACVFAVGQMCAVMPREQFETQLSRIMPIVLGMYKKEKNHLPITQGLCTILDVACKPDSQPVMEPLLNPTLNVLHPLLCGTISANSDTAIAVRTTNEMLRCFEVMAAGFPELLASYLLARLDITKVKSASIRAGTLNILKHLVNRLDEQLQDKKDLILAGIRPLIDSETSMEVRKVLCQLIISMASMGYLQLEGGQKAVEFIIKQSSITEVEIKEFEARYLAKKKPLPDMTPAKLRNMCDNILHLATTTVPAMENVLWPYLLEFLVLPQYTNAVHVICKCIGSIAEGKRDGNAPDYILDFDKEVNLPKPTEIIVRLLVMLNEPQGRGQLGKVVLRCLQSIGPVLHPMVCDMWDNAMPKLASYIENNEGAETWDSNTWEDLTLRLLAETIKVVNDEEWTQNLGEQLSKQLSYYQGSPNLKKCALKHMGLILQKLNRKSFIQEKLDMIFQVTDHSNDLERQGCAQAYGFCSASHLDIVLDKVKSLASPSTPAKKQGGGLFGMFSSSSSKSSGPTGSSKYTIFLCLGYIAEYAMPKLVVARLDSHILHTLEPFLLSKQMNNETKENLIRAIDLIARALHPSHLQEKYVFRRRDEFIDLLIQYMTAKDSSTQVRLLGLNACSTLIHLEPAMAPELEEKLVKETMRFYFDYSAPAHSKSKDSGEDYEKNLEKLDETFNETISAILYMDCSTVCLGRIFDIVSGYLTSENTSKRLRVVSSLQKLLKKFIEFKSSSEEEDPGVEDSYAALGKSVGLLVPRCTDPDPQVRMSALNCIELMFFIEHMLSTSVGQESYNLTPPDELTSAHELRGRMEDADIHEQFMIVHQISTIAAKLLPDRELPAFLVHTIKGLNDPLMSSSSGTCVMLNGMLKVRGNEVPNEVPNLVSGMLKAMEGITDDKTMNGTLHSLRTLSTHHLLPVIEELLKTPTPHSQNVAKSIQVIVKDPNLVTQVIDHLSDIMNNSNVLEENSSGSTPVWTHAPRALSATTALGEIFELEEMEEVIANNFSQIFCTVLLRFGTTRYDKTKQASPQLMTTFKNFIQCAKLESVEAKLTKNNSWAQLEDNEHYHYGITDITRAVCKQMPQEMNNIYEFILPYLQGNFSGQRVVTATVFAEMVRHLGSDRTLLQSVINNLLTIMVDNKLKLMTIRGLGNIADAGKEEVNMFSSTVIDALMCSIDADSEVLAMEAMKGLAKVFELVDERCVAPILVNICHRIRPAFEKQHNEIRCASFELFSTLHRFGREQGAQIFYEQIHNNLPTLFLHINDENESVRKACKKAMKNFAPLLKVDALVEFCNEVLPENRELNYNEFLNRLSIILINSFPEKLNFYVMTSIEFFKSEWICLRVGAAAFTGYALGNVPQEKKHAVNLNPGMISSALIGLLKQKNPEVRSQAATAMSYLYSY